MVRCCFEFTSERSLPVLLNSSLSNLPTTSSSVTPAAGGEGNDVTVSLMAEHSADAQSLQCDQSLLSVLTAVHCTDRLL